MVDALEIGYAIKKRRAQLGMTQAQVADAAGVSKRCLWSLELGQNPGVRLDKLTAVLDVLGIDLCLGEADALPGSARGDEVHGLHRKQPKGTAPRPAAAGAIDALAVLTGEA